MTLNKSSAAKLKVVVDTSVYIAAILTAGLSEDVLRLIYQGYAELYCSDDIFDELKSRLDDKPFNVEPDKAALSLREIKSIAHFVKPLPIEESRLRDIGDLHILECAVATKANLIVTFDKDLLSLKETHGIGVIHPRSFRYMATEN
ncbi:MAG: putative toxin-antitoxin system toxin component, PIN family [Candidatus Berkelbacteria bacterium]|nr:putative toxin-antitoxin system toxin component, PIN family [Candidatus Berkelbacteria bacterium]